VGDNYCERLFLNKIALGYSVDGINSSLLGRNRVREESEFPAVIAAAIDSRRLECVSRGGRQAEGENRSRAIPQYLGKEHAESFRTQLWDASVDR